MNAESLDYYKRLILDHNKNPRNYGKPESFSVSAEGYNPLCGDKIQLYVNSVNQVIEDLYFESSACALCKASTSLMSEKVSGKSYEDLNSLYDQLTQLLSGNQVEDAALKPLDVFASVAKYPARAKCVMLPWKTLQRLIGGESSE